MGSSSLFRGIANAVLGDQAYTKYPASFAYVGQGYLGESIVPSKSSSFWPRRFFAGVVLNRTVYGRHVYAVGNNKTAARFSGVPVDKVRLIAFAVNGLAAGVAAIMLTSRIGSTRPNIASGYETDVITIVVLGGVAITGGKGNIAGVIISIFLLGYLKFGMGVLNVPGKVMNIITGVLLVVAILLPSSRMGSGETEGGQGQIAGEGRGKDMKSNEVEKSYSLAAQQYAEFGVDTRPRSRRPRLCQSPCTAGKATMLAVSNTPGPRWKAEAFR